MDYNKERVVKEKNEVHLFIILIFPQDNYNRKFILIFKKISNYFKIDFIIFSNTIIFRI